MKTFANHIGNYLKDVDFISIGNNAIRLLSAWFVSLYITLANFVRRLLRIPSPSKSLVNPETPEEWEMHHGMIAASAKAWKRVEEENEERRQVLEIMGWKRIENGYMVPPQSFWSNPPRRS